MSKINCYSANLRKKTNKPSLNLRIFNICLFITIAGLGFAYLIGISDLTVKGFVLQELKIKSQHLAAEKIDNEQEIDVIQSYYALNNRAQKLNMEVISNIEYLSVNSPVVAKK